MLDTIEIVVVDPEHVEATVKTKRQVAEVLEYAKANNIKYYRGVAGSGRAYDADGCTTAEWYENPEYKEPEPETVEVAPVVDEPLETEVVETAVETESVEEIDYKSMYEAVMTQLEQERAEHESEVADLKEHVSKLEAQVEDMEKTSIADDDAYAALMEKYDNLLQTFRFLGKLLRGEVD